MTYQRSGVDAAAGEEAVRRIRPHVKRTARNEVVGDIGGFGGLFALQAGRYKEPLLVSSTDGVGTKAYIAQRTQRYDTIGIDLVAMSVDDIAVQGAEPLFFLDYVSVGHLDPEMIEQIVAGVALGCEAAGCALIGGEMSEHPDGMEPGAFDLVGFAVGVVERSRLLPSGVAPGDAIIGLASTGIRCNGYALARSALLERAGRVLDEPAWQGARRSLADELLHPSVIYSPTMLDLHERLDIHAFAHITSTGIAGNLRRVMPVDCDARIRRGSWTEPRIFAEIQAAGDVPNSEMEHVFNLGLGLLAVLPREQVGDALEIAAKMKHDAWLVGEVVQGRGEVHLSWD